MGLLQVIMVKNGLYKGEAAKEIFLQSKLPLDVLGKVWALVDSVGAGKISQNQFMAAMVIIGKLRSGQISSIPASIPQSLWNSIAISQNIISPSVVESKVSSNTSIAASVNKVQVEEIPWVIPDADQKQFSGFFDKLDKNKSGFVTGITLKIT